GLGGAGCWLARVIADRTPRKGLSAYVRPDRDGTLAVCLDAVRLVECVARTRLEATQHEIHFRRWNNKLRMRRAAPMWRNGRRNGLKIRSRESGVWVRIPSSAPSKMRFYDGNSLGFAIWSVANGRARKRTKRPS